MKGYEEQLLARMIQDKSVYFENADILTADLFSTHADIFDVYLSAVKKGRHPTLTRLIKEVPGKEKALKSMVVNADYNIPVDDLIAELEEGRRKRVIDAAILRAGLSGDSDSRVRALTDAITSLYRTERTALIDGYTAAKDAVLALHTKQKVEIPTGFRFLDALTGGLQRSDLFVVAGETSQGKTALALNITQSVLDAGRAVVFLSMEMSVSQLMLRMVCTKAGIPKKKAQAQYDIIEGVASEFASSKLYIADLHNNSVQHIMGIIRGGHIRHNIDVAVVDYLQLMNDKSKSGREQEIGHIARSLKNLAKELDICIVLLSQLGRPRQGQTHKPTLSRLRDSGQIEEAADVVMFVYRPEYYGIEEYKDEPTGGLAELIIAKGRNYGIGSFFADFEADITRFSDRGHTHGDGDHQDSPGAQDALPF